MTPDAVEPIAGNPVDQPISSGIVVAAKKNGNGFTVNTLIKAVGWLIAAVIMAISGMMWLDSQHTQIRSSITTNEKNHIKLEGKVEATVQDVVELKEDVQRIHTEQTTHGKKLDAIIIHMGIEDKVPE